MKNNKGFVLIETIITTVVLATTLLYIYSNYTNVLMNERERLNYDDIAYIYRTNYIKEYLKQFDLNSELEKLDDDNPIINIGCESQFVDAADYDACNNLMSFLHVSRIFLASNDLREIKKCDENNNSNVCLHVDFYSIADTTDYLKSLGVTDKNSEYIVIVTYEENLDYNLNLNNGTCNDKCMYNYSWISLNL